MGLYEELLAGGEKLALVGLGYVGMPIAVAFAKRVKVIGFDVNAQKIEQYRSGVDPTMEVGDEVIAHCGVDFTADETRLREAKFLIVAVPTPVYSDNRPNLEPVIGACEVVGRNLVPGSVVVFESTVYPGVTEELCRGVLEQTSGLKCGVDFKLGYSPERINPGDKLHRLDTIVKIVSGMDEETLELVAKVYELVALAGVYKAESIKVAEAAKVIENSQRDINIAFMNELSIIFARMGIDTNAVLSAAATKWNFLKFSPGLVGGHCIGVDPYYLTYKAEQLGYHSRIILAGRQINDDMGRYIAENLVKQLIAADKAVRGAKVAILGLTFKENCPDTRNTKVMDVIHELGEYGVVPVVCDPVADADEVRAHYGIELTPLEDIRGMDAVVVAVAHKRFCWMNDKELSELFAPGVRVLIDVKAIYDKNGFAAPEWRLWRL
ncbi:MAG TPA: nucleotide sugar dehydrogenase [Eubacteriales bacterium]|nr:nucleotide sugar dehydrogenase [Clostridia bacterium]HRV73923.1 nucleotide sugar dehydrogenase [Eubacteriales bacterium]